MGMVLILFGLGGFFFGVVNLVRPLGRLRVANRRRAGLVVIGSLVVMLLGGAISPPPPNTDPIPVASATTVTTETSTVASAPSTSTPTTSTSPVLPSTTSSSTSTSTTSTSVASLVVVFPPGAEVVSVTRVSDGDTVDVTFSDGSVDTVRLIGVNSPEGGECYADEATTALASLVLAAEVGLTRDVSDRDIYDRLLRYLWLPEGRFVNLELVGGGFALARDYSPDSAHAGELAAAQDDASAARAGLWAPDACGPAAGTEIIVIHIEADAPANDHENLNGEYVVLGNDGDLGVDMTGWVLKDESATHRYDFPAGYVLVASSEVTVYTGCGTDDSSALYWCSAGAVWNNDGDTAFVLDHNGNIVHSLPYVPA